ncbi:unnamed protein product [Candidula unifasciata]|uniref:SOCS box domain-containing protein n=1 Tax=Candidula unifasciata TaxID=100452 RepID=A0A8S3Z2R7_9EUPU|nr:unnamed protein product [Candidula unifasciata]
METEDQQAGGCVRQLQQQLARSIEVRNLQDCHVILDKLASPPLATKYPNSLDWYICPHQQPTPFLHAIAKGHEDIALLLLRHGCDPHADSSTLKNPGMKVTDVRMSKSIFKVVEKSGFERLLRVMLKQADKLIVDKNGDTVLHVIAKRKLCSMLEVVKGCCWLPQMLQHANNQGLLPMHVAASCNFLQFFWLLVPAECGPLADIKANTHGSLCENWPSDSWDVIKNIEEPSSTFNINAQVKGSKTSALHLCASQRWVSMLELLIQLGANVNATDSMGKTPLVECLDQRKTSAGDLYEVCRLLLQAGANVNVKSSIQYSERRSMANDDILTPLHLAASIGCKEVIELLLNNGADPRQLSADIGKIPLQFALELGHNDAALTLLSPDLYPEGFLGTHLDYAFNSLLHSADRCSPEVIRKLIDLSCPLDHPNVNHLRPLDKALSSRNIVFVELLLNTQPRIVNVHLYQDPTAYPPLHLAASSGSIRLCQILLSYGADIYARAYGKHMAYRKAFKFSRDHTALYLCEQMSRPFSLAEKEELQGQSLCDAELTQRLRHRLEEIPTLVSTCLDAIRRTLIRNHLCFKDLDTLPVPETVIKALRYQNTDLSMSE